MKYISVCSGIEAATVAWHGLGWEPVGFSEIESFPCQLLAERFPTVPNLGDMTKYREWPIERGAIDLLVGGTPCQAFSVAGLRKGLEDARGNLALTFVGMVDWYRPEWVVWENVPGVLSSSGGRDFGAFLGALGQLGYGFAYRVLDAQYFGVPQRRRRVFVVAHSSGDPRRAGEVLFEPESLRGDTKASKRAGKDVTSHAGASVEAGIWKTVGSLTASGRGVERTGESRGQDPVIAIQYENHAPAHAGASPAPGNGVVRVAVAHAQANAEVRQDGKCQSLTCIHEAPYVLYENHANDSRVTQEDSTCPTVSAFWGTGGNNTPLVQQQMAFIPVKIGNIHIGDIAKSLTRHMGSAGESQNAAFIVQQPMAVRRLTPVECERLQGFPDDWTDIRPKGKDTPDSPRYKALGNSMAVPVMRWIGERISSVVA